MENFYSQLGGRLFWTTSLHVKEVKKNIIQDSETFTKFKPLFVRICHPPGKNKFPDFSQTLRWPETDFQWPCKMNPLVVRP